ncbi:MAG: hypothetical protein HYR64_03815 [Fimbriimonas ginsengisoli]|uniref:Uncharacterized protein n=1 Tax=Fimbriimonas ginsengisoli TaxID=1005039 RepID=A0A931LUS0_FIMGI|nr:hypothetical protein [Fimbriimonas ginsengisoli]
MKLLPLTVTVQYCQEDGDLLVPCEPRTVQVAATEEAVLALLAEVRRPLRPALQVVEGEQPSGA